jgi:hypothetical protein
MTQPREKMLELLRRLKALSESKANANEAAAAASKMQELLIKYNIELAELDAARETGADYVREFMDNDDPLTDEEWTGSLIWAVAKYNFCEAVTEWRNHKRTYALVGEPHNIEIVTFIYEYLKYEIDTLSRTTWIVEDALGSLDSAYKLKGKSGPTAYRSAYEHRWKQSFKYGAVSGVTEVLKSRWAEARSGTGTGQSLMIIKDGELATALKQFYPNLGYSHASSRRLDDGGYRSGAREGRNIEIGTAVRGGEQVRKEQLSRRLLLK